MAIDTVTHNNITYYGIATYDNVNKTLGYNTFTEETNRCLSDIAANDKNRIGYPNKPTYTGKLLAYYKLELLNTVKLTIESNTAYAIQFNSIKIHYQRKQNNTYTTVKSDTYFEGTMIYNTKSSSVDIISPFGNDYAIYGESLQPWNKAVTIEINASRIWASPDNAEVIWYTDKFTTGEDLGDITNASLTLSYKFDLWVTDPFALQPDLSGKLNPYWPETSTECKIMFKTLV